MEDKYINILTDLTLEEFEAEAALNTQNPYLTFCKFILTDNQANANRQRIPITEFENLIKSGVFMPIKMAKGEISPGHKGPEPIGVITHLKQEDNRIIGLAGLWIKEREEDVELIRNKVKSGDPVQLSWEILYKDKKTDEDGIEDLLDTSLKATTIVGMPSYAGRTPIIAIASEQQEENSVEELEQLKTKISELEAKIAEYETAIAEKNTAIASKEQEIVALSEFKQTIEKKEADEKRIGEIKSKFAEAGINKEDSYFVENAERFIAMQDSDIEFMLQEMAKLATAQPKKEESASIKIPKIVDLESDDLKDPKKLAQALREIRSKK